jgi:DNA-binding HxlR family transcriptional regulator
MRDSNTSTDVRQLLVSGLATTVEKSKNVVPDAVSGSTLANTVSRTTQAQQTQRAPAEDTNSRYCSGGVADPDVVEPDQPAALSVGSQKGTLDQWSDDSDFEDTVVTDGGDDGASYLNRLNSVTQVTRAKLTQNILGHYVMLPSLKELEHYNPSRSKTTISEHLDKLVDSGVVTRVQIPKGEQQRDKPRTFFTLTDAGYDLLQDHALFLPAIDEIREDHANVERRPDIVEYELAPRPTVDVEYDHPLRGDGTSVVDPWTEGDFDRELGDIKNNSESKRGQLEFG